MDKSTHTHTKLLTAYANVMPPAFFEKMGKLQLASLHAAMNLGNNAQIEAQQAVTDHINNSVNQLDSYDKKQLQKALSELLE
ncbi:hypothetical protein [Vibrio sp. R78045]|uniref:hypothetical protein n=1 Tax=Vibrio sp. R78045 TaxID=3093868 RepID=UPI0036F31151